MELTELNRRAIRPTDGDFDGLKIVVNANAATGQYMREAAERMAAFEKQAAIAPKRKSKKKKDETLIEIFQGRGEEIEQECALLAALIKGSRDNPYLLSWDLTKDGVAIACSESELRKLHPELLRDLWFACAGACRPKLQETRTTATSRTISDSTVATTHTQDTRTDASLTM